MTKKRILILLTIVVIVIFGFFGLKMYAKTVKDKHCIVTSISSRIFDFNEFDVRVDNALNLNDFEVLNLDSNKVIFKTGKFYEGIKNEYGHCRFSLFHRGENVFDFGHYKTNNWHTNKYELTIKTDSGFLNPILKIIGPDDENEPYYNKYDKESQ